MPCRDFRRPLRLASLVVLVALALTFPGASGADPTYTCELDAPAVDGNGHSPESKLEDRLECLAEVDDTDPAGPLRFENFKVYYNPSSTRRLPAACGGADCGSRGCELILPSDAKLVGTFLECAWSLFHHANMTAPRLDLAFDTPHGSRSIYNPDFTYIPIWINKCQGFSAGLRQPRVVIPATKGLVAPGIDSNAIHEYAHVLFKSYEPQFNGGATDFINEGLPSYLGHVLSPQHDPPTAYFASGRDLESYVSISGASGARSLREVSYGASPFWLYLAQTYSRLPTDETYARTMLSIPCRSYLDHLDPAMPRSEMYRIMGRDVIHTLQSAFRDCFPAGGATPVCRAESGKSLLALHCAGEGGWEDGCIPANTWDLALRSENLHMPRALSLLDLTMEASFGLVADGMPYQVFRDWLIHNGRLGGDRTDAHWDDEAYRLNAFGAHYHSFDLAEGDWTVHLQQGADLPRWAHTVYYVPAGGGPEVVLRDWSDDPRQTIHIPADPLYERAVLVVTAFEGTYRRDEHSSYDSSGGHYLLLTDRDRPFAGRFGALGFEVDLAIFSPHNRLWWIDLFGDGKVDRLLGGLVSEGQEVLVGDFDADGESELAWFDPATGTGLYRNSLEAPTASTFGHRTARPGRQYVALDYDCNGRDGVAAFDPASATWWVDDPASVSGLDHDFAWGEAGALVFSGDFDRDRCRDDVGYFRPSDGSWHYNSDLEVETTLELCCAGEPEDRPFAGDLALETYPDGLVDDIGFLRLADHRVYYWIDHDRGEEVDGWHRLGLAEE